MRLIPKAILSVFFASCVATAPFAAKAASIFNFQFDQQGFVSGDGPIAGTVVGNGTFTSPTDLAPGTYDLSSLSGFTLNFSFIDGDSYTTVDIITPLTGVAVRITDLGGGFQRLFFTEGSGVGKDGGIYMGSLDLRNGVNGLTFEPTNAGGNFLYQEIGASLLIGRYVASSVDVPEPASIALFGLGLLALATSRREAVKK